MRKHPVLLLGIFPKFYHRSKSNENITWTISPDLEDPSFLVTQVYKKILRKRNILIETMDHQSWWSSISLMIKQGFLFDCFGLKYIFIQDTGTIKRLEDRLLLPKWKVIWEYFLRLEVYLSYKLSDHLPAPKCRFGLITDRFIKRKLVWYQITSKKGRVSDCYHHIRSFLKMELLLVILSEILELSWIVR